ncbi:MAG TPA: hypothetical protein VNK82_01120 [Terriglobales bacterium]|nr:hypothetical protein [Terriglobales bacterium]
MHPARWTTLVSVAAFVLLSEAPAFAYTDPGSGMLLWQGLMAALVGAGFYFRKLLFRLVPFRKKSEEPKQ